MYKLEVHRRQLHAQNDDQYRREFHWNKTLFSSLTIYNIILLPLLLLFTFTHDTKLQYSSQSIFLVLKNTAIF